MTQEQKNEALELIIFKDVDIWLLKNADYVNYVRIRNNSLIDSRIYCDDGAIIDNQLTQKEFDFLKEVCYESDFNER